MQTDYSAEAVLERETREPSVTKDEILKALKVVFLAKKKK